MHHLAAYRIASATTAVQTDITAVADQILTIQNGHFLPQRDLDVVFAWSGAASNDNLKLITPKMRQTAIPNLRPINSTLIPTTVTPVVDFRKFPLRVRALEEIRMDGIQASGGGVPIVAMLGLMWNNIPAPMGDIITLRGVGATTLTVGVWNPVAVTWDDIIPAGNYACVGLNVVGTSVQGARLTFDNQYPRPGCIGVPLNSSNPHPMFEKGGLGVWGYFTSTRLPSLEVFSSAADTAQGVFMDIIKLD